MIADAGGGNGGDSGSGESDESYEADNEVDYTDSEDDGDGEFFDDLEDDYVSDDEDDGYGEDEGEEVQTSAVEEEDAEDTDQADNVVITKEQLQKEVEEARAQGLRQGRINAFVGKVNHFTGEEIKDSADLSVYEIMQKIESNGGDPINDMHKHMADSLRGRQEVATQLQAQNDMTNKDIKHFTQQNPDVSVSELMADEDFMMVAEGRLGRVPLSIIYDNYKSIKSRIGETAERQAKSMVAKQKASPGALRGTGKTETKTNESKLYEAMLRGSLD